MFEGREEGGNLPPFLYFRSEELGGVGVKLDYNRRCYHSSLKEHKRKL